jgi:hypothetical protein
MLHHVRTCSSRFVVQPKRKFLPRRPARQMDRREHHQAVSGCQRVVRLCENPGTVLCWGNLKLPPLNRRTLRFFFYQTRGVRSRSFASALLPRPQAQRRVNRRSHRVASQQPPAGDRAGPDNPQAGGAFLVWLGFPRGRPAGARRTHNSLGAQGNTHNSLGSGSKVSTTTHHHREKGMPPVSKLGQQDQVPARSLGIAPAGRQLAHVRTPPSASAVQGHIAAVSTTACQQTRHSGFWRGC